MAVPQFDFTSRAVPVVQVGRFQFQFTGRDRWGRGRWGDAHWGGPLGPAIWADVSCEVHEVTTNTGRGSASDTLVPATAEIIASNVGGWGDGDVPLQWSFFDDDFEREGPELDSAWGRWPAMNSFRPRSEELVIPTEEDEIFIPGEGWIVPQGAMVRARKANSPPTRRANDLFDVRSTWSGSGTAATIPIGPFPGVQLGDVVWVGVFIADGDVSNDQAMAGFPGWIWRRGTGGALGYPAPTFKPSTWSYQNYRRRMNAEDVTDLPTYTLTMPNSREYCWFAVAVTGVIKDGTGFLSNIGPDENMTMFVENRVGVAAGGTIITNGSSDTDRPENTIVVRMVSTNPVMSVTTPAGTTQQVTVSAPTFPYTQRVYLDTTATGTKVYPKTETPASKSFPLTTPPASPWTFQSASMSILAASGLAAEPPVESYPYEGYSHGLWSLAFTGDHFIEATVTGLAAPDRLWPEAWANVELYLLASESDMTAAVARFEWRPSWDVPADTGTLHWELFRRLADGTAAAPVASGDVDYGAEGFPEVVVFRFEADIDGKLAVYLDGRTLGTGTLTTVPTGQRVGVYADYYTGIKSTMDAPVIYGANQTVLPVFAAQRQLGPVRFLRITGGSNIPVPIELEPGALIRIGVVHERYGPKWFFRGWVDGLVPTYDPERADTVRIECIDALGEVGRLTVPQPDFNEREATDRIRQILNAAEWHVQLRQLDDDATLVTDISGDEGRAMDLLVQTAASCGGAVYGSPSNGDLVFRRRDWQAFEPGTPPDAFITNKDPDAVEFIGLIACPSGWERSWHRADMTTEVELTNQRDEVVIHDAPTAIERWGTEEWNASVVTARRYDMKILARRQLLLRGPNKFPRVEAVLFDAATSTEALDLMTLADFTRPTRYQCQLRSDGDFKFNKQYILTGVRHTMSRNRWQTRLALDAAGPFAVGGGRWGDPDNPLPRSGLWGRDKWGLAR